MRPKLWFAIAVFIGSYLPLAAILFIQDIDYKHSPCWQIFSSPGSCRWFLQHPLPAILSVAVALFGFGITLFALSVSRSSIKIKISENDLAQAELISYTFPYIVALIVVDYGDSSKCIGVIAFLAWIFIVTYRAGLLGMNPLFAVFDWKLYKIKFSYAGSPETHTSYALSKTKIKKDSIVEVRDFQQVFFVS